MATKQVTLIAVAASLTTVAIIAALLWVAGVAGAGPLASNGGSVPRLINYQGRLTDAAGNPLTGSYNMTFCLYDVATGGTALWSETQAVNVTYGVFNALLPIPATAFANPDLYLGVKVGGDSEMSPRRRVVSAGYAYRAEDAAQADQATNAAHATQADQATNADTVDGLHASEISTAVEDKRNLAIKVNATSPASQIDIDADYLMVENAGLAAVNLTADITVSGANGLDTGAEAPETWYSIWVIHGSSGTAALLSTSTASPTMPSGYTKKRRVGWVYNDSNGDFRKSYHRGDWWFYDAEQSALSGGTATIFTDVDLSSLIPPTAKAVCLYYQFQGDGRGMTFWLRPDGTNWTLPIENVGYGNHIAGISIYEKGQTEIPVTNQIIEYKSDGGYGINSVDLSVKGYYDP